MARTLSIQTQLNYHKVNHFVYPFSSELLELIQQTISVQVTTFTLTKLTAHELNDDSLTHFRPIIVVIFQNCPNVEAWGCQSLKDKESKEKKGEDPRSAH